MRTQAIFSVVLFVSSSLVACSGAQDDVSSSGESVTKVCGASSGSAVQGVDVSVYQGNFNWPGAHVEFGYARISDGTGYVDPKFEENWTNMKSAGVLRGAYQFFEPGESEVSQANMMVAKVGKLGEGDLPAMIDVEVTGGQSKATIAAKVRHWLEIVESGTGKRPIIYTGSYFWQDNVGDTTFGKYPIWIAAYGVSCPSLPPGWSKWLMWQYSDGGGSLDHDVFNGSLSELKALAGAPSGPPTAKPAAPSGCGEIKAGQGLVAGESYASCDGRFTLAMQTDGNLVVYLDGRAMWATGTAGTDGYAAIMQGDGNFVLYGKYSDALWASHTEGHAGAHLALQNDGNAVVYEGASALWASGTNVMATPGKPAGCGTMTANTALTSGETLAACDGHHVLAMQTDGNLVWYDGSTPLWASHTNGTLGYAAIMQGDGNFVLYDARGKALWSSVTQGHPGSDLALQNDGNLVVYQAGKPIWATGTNGK